MEVDLKAAKWTFDEHHYTSVTAHGFWYKLHNSSLKLLLTKCSAGADDRSQSGIHKFRVTVNKMILLFLGLF